MTNATHINTQVNTLRNYVSLYVRKGDTAMACAYAQIAHDLEAGRISHARSRRLARVATKAGAAR